MLSGKDRFGMIGTTALRVGMVFAAIAVVEMVFDLSGARAVSAWKVETTKTKKNRRALS